MHLLLVACSAYNAITLTRDLPGIAQKPFARSSAEHCAPHRRGRRGRGARLPDAATAAGRPARGSEEEGGWSPVGAAPWPGNLTAEVLRSSQRTCGPCQCPVRLVNIDASSQTKGPSQIYYEWFEDIRRLEIVKSRHPPELT